MNKDEYWQTVNYKTDPIYKKVHKELKKWKFENGITETCVVHHRDDTEDARDYNEKYYERWGCEEDGTFVEGKYVQFLTNSAHMRYHNSGEKHPMYGKPSTFRGKHHTDEARIKISDATKGEKNPFYGKHHADECRKNISASLEGRTLSDKHRQNLSTAMKCKMQSEELKQNIATTCKANMKLVSDLWNLYKQLHPNYTMTFNEFQHSLKTNKES